MMRRNHVYLRESIVGTVQRPCDEHELGVLEEQREDQCGWSSECKEE